MTKKEFLQYINCLQARKNGNCDDTSFLQNIDINFYNIIVGFWLTIEEYKTIDENKFIDELINNLINMFITEYFV